VEYMFIPFMRYADFNGRSRRKEFWMFALLQIILMIVAIAMVIALEMTAGPRVWIFTPVVLWLLATFLPGLGVQVRRFHDQNRSGWMMLLALIPYVGGLIVLVFMCLDGTPGDNRFGRDPKKRGGERLTEIFQ
jgi:uncharacterized membrane protein YhaH (DUF805 family)